MERTMISFNAPNTITVGLMLGLFYLGTLVIMQLLQRAGVSPSIPGA